MVMCFRRKNHLFHVCFWTSFFQANDAMSAKRFAQLFGDLTAYIGPIKSKTLRWVLIHYWNTANTMYPCKLQLFSAKNPTCSRRVLEIGLQNVHTCFVSPCRSVNEILGWFCLTRPKYQNIHRRKNDQISGGKKRSETGWQGLLLIEHVQIFWIYFPKTPSTCDC